MRLLRSLVFAVAAALALPAAAQSPETVHIGVVPSLSAASTYLAIEKGYFRDVGLDVKMEFLDTSASIIPFLASNRMQVVEGGLSVAYFNAVAQGLPVMMAFDRGSSPFYHDMLVRPDLADKIKTIADLKGRSVAIVAPGSTSVYEVGKLLETAGLTIKDIDIKFMPLSQVGVAFANKGIDVANTFPPFGEVVVSKGLGVRWIDPDDYVKPAPMDTVGYLINTDWSAQNHAVAQRLFLALARADREYCQDYHHGPQRADAIDALVKYDHSLTRELAEKASWSARNPNGRINVASVLDIQNWFVKEGMLPKALPAERVVDNGFADYVAKELGPFELINKDSPLKGCR